MNFEAITPPPESIHNFFSIILLCVVFAGSQLAVEQKNTFLSFGLVIHDALPP